MIPEAAVEAAARTLHANSIDSIANSLPWGDLTDEQRATFGAATMAILTAAAPHMLAMEAKLAAIIVLLDPFERVTGWMATDDEAGRYAVEAINKIRAILDTP